MTVFFFFFLRLDNRLLAIAAAPLPLPAQAFSLKRDESSEDYGMGSFEVLCRLFLLRQGPIFRIDTDSYINFPLRTLPSPPAPLGDTGDSSQFIRGDPDFACRFLHPPIL